MIAISLTEGGFSPYWVQYCEENHIEYKIVDCYSNSIINDLDGCDILMWHPIQYDYKAELFFKQLIYSVEASGIKVFPNFHTVWHFDDKLGQKYLLESVKAPFVKTFVFYSKKEALEWTKKATFPIVFKLRRGAGSSNVFLLKGKRDAIKHIEISFSSGHSQYNSIANFKERYRKFKLGRTGYINVLKGFFRLFYKPYYTRVMGRDIGYIYFQEFHPNNTFDIRIVVIGNRAFGIKRIVRANDFRASGSGHILYQKEEIDERCVKIAFEVNRMLHSQCIAYDFIYDIKNTPLIIEVSYGFVPEGYTNCTGFWDESMHWHPGKFNPYGWMVESMIMKVQN